MVRQERMRERVSERSEKSECESVRVDDRVGANANVDEWTMGPERMRLEMSG